MTTAAPTPPKCPKKPRTLVHHGEARVDDYFWLRQKNDPETLSYLDAENAYFEQVLGAHRLFQDELFEELKARIKEDDSTVPVRVDDYFYYRRMEAGLQYAIHCRKHLGLDAPEEIILDENELARGQDYFRLGVLKVSPDHKTLAYSVDLDGSERFTVFFKDLKNHLIHPDRIPMTATSLEWAEDAKTVFYVRLDEHDRSKSLYRHVLGEPSETDKLIHFERDETLFVSCAKSRSRKYVFLISQGKITSEVRFIDAHRPREEFRVIEPRRRGVLYHVDHHGDSFFILTNDTARNFRLVEAPVASPGQENWKQRIAGDESRFLVELDAFKDFLVLRERENGLPQIRVIRLDDWSDHRVEFPEPTYYVSGDANPMFDSATYRLGYTSLITPSTVFEYDLRGRKLKTLKVQEIPTGYDKSKFVSERLFATAPDGTRIPISIVYPKDYPRDGTGPLYLYGYGSYGYSMPAGFTSTRLSLLERGVAFAIAHIRGGSDMGRPWYEDGKFLKKKNTFTDFIACAEHLIEKKYTGKGRIVIAGGSAGGLLVGATVNLKPELFKGAVAHVPFVDVLNTMLDKTLPLTTLEFEEWGNPEDPEYYRYIKSYSPYDNVERKAYPNMLVTAGLNDPRVTYWEPAKWVAKLRELKTDSNLLLFRTHMESGHGGASGRYDSLKEIAEEYTFVCKIFHLIP